MEESLKELTERQEEILKYMTENQATICPTYGEIASEFKITRKGAYDHVGALIKKGFVEKVTDGDLRSKIIIKSGE